MHDAKMSRQSTLLEAELTAVLFTVIDNFVKAHPDITARDVIEAVEFNALVAHLYEVAEQKE